MNENNSELPNADEGQEEKVGETTAETVANSTEDGAPAKSQEPSSGTDDDEPSAQPAENLEKADAENENVENAPVERKKTVEETRAEFVNEGLLRWETARTAWLGERANGSDDSGSSARPTAVPLDVDKIIDVLFYASSREARAGSGKPEKFPRNVPLPQMVDILQDLWEAEGLDA